MIKRNEREKCHELLKKGLEVFNIFPTNDVNEKILSFLDELIYWNTKINLIGTETPEEITVRHILDSFSIAHLVENSDGPIVDLGPGGGFPSIPLAIVFRDRLFIGVERRLKRASFLEYIVLRLGLDNYKVFSGDIAEFKGKASMVIARGVGTCHEIYRAIKHVLKPLGILILLKGKKEVVEREIDQLKKGISDKEKIKVSYKEIRLPFLDEERNIVTIKQI